MTTDRSVQPPQTIRPLADTAHFVIETTDGYVRVEQSIANSTRYTPEEARDIAQSIIEAAEQAEQ